MDPTFSELNRALVDGNFQSVAQQTSVDLLLRFYPYAPQLVLDELKSKVIRGSTFAFSIVTRGSKIYAHGFLGFSEEYGIIDVDRSPLLSTDPVAKFYAMITEDYVPSDQEFIIKHLLTEQQPKLTVFEGKIVDVLNGDIPIEMDYTDGVREIVSLLWNVDVEEKDYNYPGAWDKIHRGTKTLDVSLFTNWVSAVVYNLPCPICKAHGLDYISRRPPRHDLFEWTWEFHNEVNRRLEKPTITLEQARVLYL